MDKTEEQSQSVEKQTFEYLSCLSLCQLYLKEKRHSQPIYFNKIKNFRVKHDIQWGKNRIWLNP